MSTQSKKAPHPVLRGLGILLLVILLIIGILYYTITTDSVTIDDPASLAAQTPMPASQRFVFDATNETAQIILDKSDLWWLLLPEMEANFLENANQKLESYGLTITGYGFNITKKGICVDLDAMYQSVRLPVHILTSLDFDASGFSLGLTSAKLGPIPLPAADLLSSVDGRIDVDWPVITDVTAVAYQPDTVILTGTLTQDMLSCVQKACQNDAIGWLSTSHQEIFRTARAADGFRQLLPGLEQDPGSIEALYHDLFTLSLVTDYEDYMKASRNLPHRFFPSIDYASLEKEADSVRSQWVYYNVLVDKLVTQVSHDFNNRRFSLKNGEFYYKKSVFDVCNYFTDDTSIKIEQMFHMLDQDKFHLVLVGSINGYAVDSPVLNKICSKKQALTQELNRKAAYPVGCVFQGLNGEYFLRYESMKISGTGNQMSKWLKTVTLTEAEYNALIQEGKIGVWIS